MVSLEMKRLTTINVFKRKVKQWKDKNCPCRLRKPYTHSIGFNNAYWANVPFLTPWKHQKTLSFSDVFRGPKRKHWLNIDLTQYKLIFIEKLDKLLIPLFVLFFPFSLSFCFKAWLTLISALMHFLYSVISLVYFMKH